jgi:hypothetical protein
VAGLGRVDEYVAITGCTREQAVDAWSRRVKEEEDEEGKMSISEKDKEEDSPEHMDEDSGSVVDDGPPDCLPITVEAFLRLTPHKQGAFRRHYKGVYPAKDPTPACPTCNSRFSR